MTYFVTIPAGLLILSGSYLTYRLANLVSSVQQLTTEQVRVFNQEMKILVQKYEPRLENFVDNELPKVSREYKDDIHKFFNEVGPEISNLIKSINPILDIGQECLRKYTSEEISKYYPELNLSVLRLMRPEFVSDYLDNATRDYHCLHLILEEMKIRNHSRLTELFSEEEIESGKINGQGFTINIK